MLGEPTHPTATEMEKHKQLDHEIQDMIAALNKRLAELQHIHKSSSASSHGQLPHAHDHQDNDHHGLRIITLAGSNQGATMHGEVMDEKSAGGDDADPYDTLGTYVNSNFQSINNSIVIEGSYTTNDPGVHMDISDLIIDPHHQHGHHDHHQHGHHGHRHGHGGDDKNGKKKMKQDKENGKGEQHHSDKSD